MFYQSLTLMFKLNGCPDRTKFLVVRVGPGWSGIPDQVNFGPVRWSGIPDQLGPGWSVGPEFRTSLSWSGPMVRNSGPSWSGLVRWSGIPYRQNLVRSVGPEFRTGPTWSVKLVRIFFRTIGPDQLGPGWSVSVRNFKK